MSILFHSDVIIIFLLLFPYFCYWFANSLQSFMIILYKSNLCVIHVTNLYQYSSSTSQV
jgi:hypothetical protein